MTVKYVLSNHLHVTGLPQNLKDFYKGHCQYCTESYASKDVPPNLDLYVEHEDGSISIPRGLEAELVSFLEHAGLPYTKEENTAVGEAEHYTVQPEINYTSGPYGYQGRVVEELLKHVTGRLESPAGSGKTNMACLTTAFLQEGPILFLVNKDKLFRQFVKTVSKVLGIPKEEVGVIKAKKRVIKPITCGSLKTLGKKGYDLDSLKDTFTTVFFDECHISSALTYRSVLLALAPKRLYGLSATPKHYASSDLNRLMDALLGKVVVRVKPEEIPQRLIPETYTRETGCSFPYDAYPGDPDWKVHQARHKMMEAIQSHAGRNATIVQDSKNLLGLGLKLLIGVTRVEHGRILRDLFKQEGIPVSFPYKHVTKLKKRRGKTVKDKDGNDVRLDGLGVDHKQLDLDLDMIEDGLISVIIGTYELFDTGFDCPSLGAVIAASPFSGMNSTKVIQLVGRVQRFQIGKDVAVLVDYTDDSHPNNKLREWSDDRIQVCISEFNKHSTIPFLK